MPFLASRVNVSRMEWLYQHQGVTKWNGSQQQTLQLFMKSIPIMSMRLPFIEDRIGI